MALIPLPFPSESAPGRFGEDGATRLINAVVEKTTLYGKPMLVAYPRPGASSFATLTGATGGVRALFSIDDTLYAVAGRQIYAVNIYGTVSQLSGGISADGPVRFARNMASIPMVAMVAGGSLTILQGGTLTEVSDPDLPPPQDVAFLGGYLVYPIQDGRFFWSAINASDVGALDFASNEYNADKTLRCLAHRLELWFFGQTTIEVWGLTGNVDAPFQRVAVRDIGCKAAGSVAELDQSLIWIDRYGRVVRSSGYDAARISHHAVERAIASVDPGTITATTFSQQGHSYYVMSSAEWTWVYDVGYGWSEWKTTQFDRWNIAACVDFNNTVVAGSSVDGSLVTLSQSVANDDGDDLVWSVRTMTPATYPRGLKMSAVYANMIAGRAPVTGADTDTDPVVMLRLSRDGGNTWPVYQEQRLGRIGNRNAQVIFRRLGATDRIGATLELSMSANVRTGLAGIYAMAEGTAA